MRVLITGCTPRHVGSKKLLMQYMHGSHVLEAALRAAGHEPDVRAVSVTETTLCDDYDCALVGIAPPLTFVSTGLLGALHTVRSLGPRAALWCDDWSVENFRHHSTTVMRNPSKYLWGRFKRPGERELLGLSELGYQELCENKARVVDDEISRPFVETLRELVQGDRRPLLAWFHGWGDPERWRAAVKLKAPVVRWDPTKFIWTRPHLAVGAKEGEFDYPTPLQPTDRARSWVSASLQDVSRWTAKAGLGWPVLRLGNRKQGNPVVKEREVLAAYGRHWGVLCPSYNKAPGTGWWRARYLHSAKMGCVLHSSPGEEGFHPGYGAPAGDLESAPDSRLEEIAGEQRSTLLKESDGEDCTLVRLEGLLQSLLDGSWA